MRQSAVICYEKKSFSIAVKTSNRKQVSALRLRDQVDNSFFSVILACADDSRGFVQHVVNEFLIPDNRPLEDYARRRVNTVAGILYDFPVDADAALADILFQFASSTDTHVGQILV